MVPVLLFLEKKLELQMNVNEIDHLFMCVLSMAVGRHESTTFTLRSEKVIIMGLILKHFLKFLLNYFLGATEKQRKK